MNYNYIIIYYNIINMNIKLIVIILLIFLIIYLFFKMNNNKNEHIININTQLAPDEVNAFSKVLLNNNSSKGPIVTYNSIEGNNVDFTRNFNANNANINNVKILNLNASNNINSNTGNYSNNITSESITGNTLSVGGNLKTKNVNLTGDLIVDGDTKINNFNFTENSVFKGNLQANNINGPRISINKNVNAVTGNFTGDITNNNMTLTGTISGKNGIFANNISGLDANFNTINTDKSNFGIIQTDNLTVTDTFTGPDAQLGNFSSSNGNFITLKSNNIISEEASFDNLDSKLIYFNNKLTGNVAKIDTINGVVNNNGVTNGINSNFNIINSESINSKNFNSNQIDGNDISITELTTINNNTKNFKNPGNGLNISSENIETDTLSNNIIYAKNANINNKILIKGEDISLKYDLDYIKNNFIKLCNINNNNCIDVSHYDILKLYQNYYLYTQINPILNSDIQSQLYLDNSVSKNYVLWDNTILRNKMLEQKEIFAIIQGDAFMVKTGTTTGGGTYLINNTAGDKYPTGGKYFCYSTQMMINTGNNFIPENTNTIEIIVPTHPDSSKGIDYTVFWIQVLNNRWSYIKIHTGPKSPIPNKSFGKYTGGYKKTCAVFPNPELSNYNSNLQDINDYNWIPIPINLKGITDRRIRLSSIYGEFPLYFTQIAFSTNPYNHCKLNALSLHWQINKLDATGKEIVSRDNDSTISGIGWETHDWGYNIKEQLGKFIYFNKDLFIRIPFVNSGKNKTFYLCEYFAYDPSKFYLISFTIKKTTANSNNVYTEFMKPINLMNKNVNNVELFYTNAFTNNRYYGITIPLQFLPDKDSPNDNFINITINIRKNNMVPDVLYFKEMGSYDEIIT